VLEVQRQVIHCKIASLSNNLYATLLYGSNDGVERKSVKLVIELQIKPLLDL